MPARFGYALALARDGKPGEALPVVRCGLVQAPTLAEGHLVFAVVLIELRRMDEAEKSAREALLLHGPSAKQAYLALASIHAQRGDYRAEAQDLQIYLKLEPRAAGREKLIDAMEVARRLAAEHQASGMQEPSGHVSLLSSASDR